MRKWAVYVAVAAALFGAVIAGISTHQHFRLAREGFEKQSFCAISETVNCDIVNASSYSEFMGVPIAWWGLLFYIAIAGLSIFAIVSKTDRRSSVAVAWFLSLGGIAYSAWLAYIAFFVLEVVCIECLAMYAANILLVIFLFIALRVPVLKAFSFVFDYAKAVFGKPLSLDFKPHVIKYAIAIAILYLAGWVVIAGVQGKEKDKRAGSVDEKVKAFYMQSEYPIVVDSVWPVWGNPDAKTTIVEYSEFQCPFCRIAAFQVKPYLQEFRKDIKVYFVNFPLDNSCNDTIDRATHPMACYLARASVCAQKKGDFWKFHEAIFRNQKKISKETILSLAKERGWDETEFANCIASTETDARVRADVASGKKIYVEGTPTIFLNNRKLNYWSDPKFLQRIVKEEIKRMVKNK